MKRYLIPLLALIVVLLCAPAAHGATPCFGAAALDPEHQPCHNPALRLKVTPSLVDALLQPSAACTPIASEIPPFTCWFGVPKGQATKTFALIGDSHAVHWRAAMNVVARAKGWRGISIDRSRCPYTMGRTALAGAEGRSCMLWHTQVRGWLKRHPEVTMVVVSQNSGTGVRPAGGLSFIESKIAGYANAWQALPPSVRKIFVLRDVSHVKPTTAPCIRSALRAGKSPGPACALPRSVALADDAALTAVTRLDNPRVQAIDLTDFMCNAIKCYPVVGGVLVHRDIGHMTRTFSETLGPYLLRALDRAGTG